MKYLFSILLAMALAANAIGFPESLADDSQVKGPVTTFILPHRPEKNRLSYNGG
jgi:hypothetical protein